MSLKQIDLLLYVWLLINAIGWFGFLALPRLRKSLSCKEKADGVTQKRKTISVRFTPG